METTEEDREDLCDSTIVKKEFEAKMNAEDAPTSTDDDERDFHDDIHPLEAVKVELHIKEEEETATSNTFNENIQKYLEASASGGALRCCFCSRQFEQKFLLKRHLHTHMDNRPSFSCKFCGNTYIWMVSLRRHLKKCQQKSQKRETCVAQYRCSTCWKRFNQEIYLTEHQKVCSGKVASTTSQNTTMQNSNQPPDAASVAFEKLPEAKLELFECDVCLKKFKNRDFFEKHQGIHTLLQTPHNCNFCGNTYKYRASLVRHQLLCEVMDEQTLPYTCPYCGNCFNQVFSLTQHRKVCGKQSSTGGEKLIPKNSPNVRKEEEIASKEVKNENEAPKEISRPFTCKICGNTYRHSHSMKRHQQLCKQMGVAPKYSCSICGNKFHDKISMGQHWRVCRGHLKKGADVGKPKISSNLIKLPKRKPGLFPCETCSRTYTWEMNLRRHQRTCVKPLAGDLLHFSCQKCGSRFNGQISLDKHAKICSSNATNEVKKKDVVPLEEKRVNLKKPLLPYTERNFH